MSNKSSSIKIFFVIIALTGLALGFSDTVFSNYFRDAYQVDGFMRGILEFPREVPGILCMLIISGLAFLGDIRLAIIAQALCAIGLFALGLYTPPFVVMMIPLFINSIGLHMFMPLADSIGMSLADEGKIGLIMGKLNGVRTAFMMVAGIVVFAGFKTGFFSFTTPIKLIFLLAAAIYAVILILLVKMQKLSTSETTQPKFRIAFYKEYRIYYLIAILFGARKQIMFVYAPWVLIELLDFGADTMSILAIAGAGIGIFFIPAVGRWIDRYGTARIMMFEAAFFFVIYIVYGVLCAGLTSGQLASASVLVIAIASGVNILDRMTIQFGMVRSIYMCSIALKPEHVTPTLSVGLTLDHIITVAGALLCGYLWREWGPQYVFVLAALLSIANMIVALHIKKHTASA